MTECCRTCRHRLDIEKWDYSHGGCVHEDVDGFVCTCLDTAIWMVGTDEDTDYCECYERRVCLHCGSGDGDDGDGETPLSAEWKNELRPVQADIDDAYYEYGRKHQEGE